MPEPGWEPPVHEEEDRAPAPAPPAACAATETLVSELAGRNDGTASSACASGAGESSCSCFSFSNEPAGAPCAGVPAEPTPASATVPVRSYLDPAGASTPETAEEAADRASRPVEAPSTRATAATRAAGRGGGGRSNHGVGNRVRRGGEDVQSAVRGGVLDARRREAERMRQEQAVVAAQRLARLKAQQQEVAARRSEVRRSLNLPPVPPAPRAVERGEWALDLGPTWRAVPHTPPIPAPPLTSTAYGAPLNSTPALPPSPAVSKSGLAFARTSSLGVPSAVQVVPPPPPPRVSSAPVRRPGVSMLQRIGGGEPPLALGGADSRAAAGAVANPPPPPPSERDADLESSIASTVATCSAGEETEGDETEGDGENVPTDGEETETEGEVVTSEIECDGVGSEGSSLGATLGATLGAQSAAAAVSTRATATSVGWRIVDDTRKLDETLGGVLAVGAAPAVPTLASLQ